MASPKFLSNLPDSFKKLYPPEVFEIVEAGYALNIFLQSDAEQDFVGSDIARAKITQIMTVWFAQIQEERTAMSHGIFTGEAVVHCAEKLKLSIKGLCVFTTWASQRVEVQFELWQQAHYIVREYLKLNEGNIPGIAEELASNSTTTILPDAIMMAVSNAIFSIQKVEAGGMDAVEGRILRSSLELWGEDNNLKIQSDAATQSERKLNIIATADEIDESTIPKFDVNALLASKAAGSNKKVATPPAPRPLAPLGPPTTPGEEGGRKPKRQQKKYEKKKEKVQKEKAELTIRSKEFEEMVRKFAENKLDRKEKGNAMQNHGEANIESGTTSNKQEKEISPSMEAAEVEKTTHSEPEIKKEVEKRDKTPEEILKETRNLEETMERQRAILVLLAQISVKLVRSRYFLAGFMQALEGQNVKKTTKK